MGYAREVWIDIEGFPSHMVSSQGRVRNWKSGIVLSPRLSGWGYLQVVLYKKGKTYTKSIHRLVAEAFFYGEDDEVNHIDGDKLNNFVGNLEWVTKTQNNQHAIDIGLRIPRGVPITIIESGLEFDNLKSCAEYLGCSTTIIRYNMKFRNGKTREGLTLRYGRNNSLSASAGSH